MWGRAVDCVILLSLQEHLQEESTRYCPSALGSQIAGGLCVASILIDFRTFKLRKSCGLLLLISLVISHSNADNPIYRRWLGQFVYPLGVELDITVEDQQVRASLTACAVTLLAHVVNRYLLL